MKHFFVRTYDVKINFTDSDGDSGFAGDVSTGKLNIDTVARLKPMAKPPVPATAGDIY